MSRDLGRDVPDLEKFNAGKLWADFPHPIFKRLYFATTSYQKATEKHFYGLSTLKVDTMRAVTLQRRILWQIILVKTSRHYFGRVSARMVRLSVVPI